MDPITVIDEAVRTIEEYRGSPEDFELPIADSMNDAIGLNMAIVTDATLKKGWMPNGFSQENGFRIYRYVAA